MIKRQEKGNFFECNFFSKNRKGISAILVLVLILLIGGGIYLLLLRPSQPSGENAQNQSVSGQTHNIEMKNFAFLPSTLNIKAGDTVIWTNGDATPHKIISDTGTELNSPQINSQGVFAHTFSTAGTFNYHCSIHPSIMKGAITVS